MPINKILTKIVTLSLITISIMYATGFIQFEQILSEKSYQDMSLTQLQEEVETRSQEGDLPFELGLELIERWTQKS